MLETPSKMIFLARSLKKKRFFQRASRPNKTCLPLRKYTLLILITTLSSRYYTASSTRQVLRLVPKIHTTQFNTNLKCILLFLLYLPNEVMSKILIILCLILSKTMKVIVRDLVFFLLRSKSHLWKSAII
jgi:hypothetical protein